MATILQTLSDLGRRLGVTIRSASSDTASGQSSVFTFIDEAYHSTADDRERIQKLRDFFEGDQIRGTGLNNGTFYIPLWPDESEEDQETRADRMEYLAWNRVRDGVLTHADALYAWGRGRSVHRRIEWEDNEDGQEQAQNDDREWLEKYFTKRMWKINNYAWWLWNVWSLVGAESRAVVLHRWMDGSDRRLREFTTGPDRRDMRRSGVVWSELLDNLQVIPLPHVDQNRELGAVIRWYADPVAQTVMGGAVSPTPGNNDTITELITDTLWMRFRGRALVQHQWGTENRYGDIRTLFTWIRNPAEIADSEDALPMQVMLLEDIYNGSEIKRNHAFPETLYTGYDPPTREENGRKILLRGPNIAHIAPEKGADIKKVGPPANVSDIGISQSDIHQALDEAMGLSVVERSSEGLGQIRSAPGIGRMQAKSERRRRRKMMAAETAEQDLFLAARDMTLYHAFPPEDRRDLKQCHLVVQFPDDAFTVDPYTGAQKDQIEMQAGLTSRADQIRKRFPELSEEEILAKVEEIEKEMEKAAATRKPDPGAQSRSLAQEGAKA